MATANRVTGVRTAAYLYANDRADRRHLASRFDRCHHVRPIDPRGCACHHSCRPPRLPCGARTLGQTLVSSAPTTAQGGLQHCRFYSPLPLEHVVFSVLLASEKSLPFWEEGGVQTCNTCPLFTPKDLATSRRYHAEPPLQLPRAPHVAAGERRSPQLVAPHGSLRWR